MFLSPRGRRSLAVSILLAASAASQELESVLPPLSGMPGADLFSVALLEDMDGDGVRDFAARFTQSSTQVTVYSGDDRTELYSISLPAPVFALAVDDPGIVCIGDWDGDGIPELALATGANQSTVLIHSGRDGALLTEVETPSLIPVAAQGVDDLDGDGSPDFVVIHDGNFVETRSGSDGSLLTGYDPFSMGSAIRPTSITYVRGLDCCALPYLVVGAVDPNTLFGSVRAFFLPTGDEELSLAVTSGCDICGYLGTAVLGTQDLDGDAFSDVVVSYLVEGPTGFEFAVGAFSLIAGSQIWEVRLGPRSVSLGSSNLATDLALVGDQDGDGQPDILAGLPLNDLTGFDRGRVSLLSSATGQPIREFYGLEDEQGFGTRVASLGDLDNDGRSEALVLSAGSLDLRLFELDKVGEVNCFATINSTGQRAELNVVGSLDVAVNEFQLIATHVPDQAGIFFYGPDTVQVPFVPGVLCVGGFVSRLPVTMPQDGVLWNSVDFTNPPTALGQITAGSTVYVQAWFRDSTALGTGTNFSDSVEVTFLP